MGILRENHLQVLGFDRKSLPTADEIKSAYRQLALRWHPDRNNGDEKAAEEFKKVNEAHAFLMKTPREQRREEAEFAAGESNGSEDLLSKLREAAEKERQEAQLRREARRRQEPEERRRQREERKRRINSVNNHYEIIIRSLLPALLTALAAYIVMVPLSINVLASVAILISTYVHELAHQKKIKRFCKQHIDPEDYDEIDDDIVILSSKAGIEAKTWPGYFASLVSLPAYRSRVAFDAAKHFAVHNDEEIVAAIRRIRV